MPTPTEVLASATADALFLEFGLTSADLNECRVRAIAQLVRAGINIQSRLGRRLCSRTAYRMACEKLGELTPPGHVVGEA